MQPYLLLPFPVIDLTVSPVSCQAPCSCPGLSPPALPSACTRCDPTGSISVSPPELPYSTGFRDKQSVVRCTRADSYLSLLPLSLIHSPSLFSVSTLSSCLSSLLLSLPAPHCLSVSLLSAVFICPSPSFSFSLSVCLYPDSSCSPVSANPTGVCTSIGSRLWL